MILFYSMILTRTLNTAESVFSPLPKKRRITATPATMPMTPAPRSASLAKQVPGWCPLLPGQGIRLPCLPSVHEAPAAFTAWEGDSTAERSVFSSRSVLHEVLQVFQVKPLSEGMKDDKYLQQNFCATAIMAQNFKAALIYWAGCFTALALWGLKAARHPTLIYAFFVLLRRQKHKNLF